MAQASGQFGDRKIDSLDTAAVACLYHGDFGCAEVLFKKIDTLLGRTGTNSKKGRIKMSLAKFYTQIGQMPKSEYYLEKGYPYIKTPGTAYDSQTLASYYLVRSNNIARVPNIEKAINYLDSGLTIATRMPRSNLLADLHNSLARLYFETGQYRKMIMESDVAVASLPRVELSDSAYLNYFKGIGYECLKNYDSAMYCSARAFFLYKKQGSKYFQCMAMANMASCYMQLYQLKNDRKYLELFDQLHLDREITYAQSLQEKAGNLYGLLCGLYGEYLMYLKQYDKALKYARIYYAVSDSLKVNTDQKVPLGLIIRIIMKKSGENTDYGDAYLNAVQTAFSKENASVISGLEQKYKAKEREEALVVARNEALTLQMKAQKNKTYFVYALLSLGIITMLSVLVIRRRAILQNKEIGDLKIKALHLQMNPHFIFNCLTAVQHFILDKNPMLSNKYLSDITVLMRKTLDMSTTDVILLEDEISYLESYLSLQQLRFDSGFDYRIVCNDNIDVKDTAIYPMIVRPFVENAVEHAFPGKRTDTRNEINVQFSRVGGSLLCEVEDNGIGRTHAKEMQTRVIRKSHAINLINKRMQLLKKRAKADISVSIADKNTDGFPVGTIVTIKFPLNI